MPRFFIDYVPQEHAVLTGEDARHIVKSLRMRAGEALILCDSIGTDYQCEIESVGEDRVTVRVLSFCKTVAEPNRRVTVYQSIPKADKMDWIVQKCVELGACAVVPTVTARCVSRPDEKSAQKKCARWQKIAEEAAKQSGRGIIPQVADFLPFQAAVEQATAAGSVFLFFEGGGQHIPELVEDSAETIAVFIGPEGGFEQQEVDFVTAHGGKIGTLGPRILRAETAPIAAVTGIMLATGNL